MKAAIHSVIRAISMAATIVSIPLSATICKSVAHLAASGYTIYLGGRPLPALTSFWIIGQSNSSVPAYVALMIAGLLIALSIWVFRFPDDLPWKATAQVAIAGIAASIAFLFFGSTLVAALLPLIGKILTDSN
jgi:hypothetical protein